MDDVRNIRIGGGHDPFVHGIRQDNLMEQFGPALRRFIASLVAPGPFYLRDVLWVSTGKWGCHTSVDRYGAKLWFAHIWTDGQGQSINPLNEPGIPSGFSAAFTLPVTRETRIEFAPGNSVRVALELPEEMLAPALLRITELLDEFGVVLITQRT